MRKLPLVIYLMIEFFPAVFAQPADTNHRKADSLLAILKTAKTDTVKVHLLFNLCTAITRSDMPEELISYASEALAFSKKQNYNWGMGAANYVIGFYQYAKRNYDEAITDLSQARQSFENRNDKQNAGRCMYLTANILFDKGDYAGAVEKGNNALQYWQSATFKDLVGSCCNDLALSYSRMGNYSKGVEYAYKGLKASEAINDKKEMAQSLHLMGFLFYEFKNYENAVKNFTAASVIYNETGDKPGFARNNNMLGEILLEQGHIGEAQQKFDQSLKIYSEPGAPGWGIPWGYSNLGSVYEAAGDSLNAAADKVNSIKKYNDALRHYHISLQKFEAISDPAGVAEQTIFIGKTYFKLGQLAAAKKYLLEGLDMAVKVGEKKNLATSYLYLSMIDSATGNTESAYKYYKSYVLYKDSIFNMQSSQNLSLYKTQLDFEKKDHEINLLAAENKLQTALAEKQSQRRNFAYLFSALLLATGAYVFVRYKKQSKIKAEEKMLKERLAISQDLHDNIGSTLSSIAVYSEVAKIQGEKSGQQNMHDLLEKISTTSNEMVTEMNDIVWAINPRNDSMEKIIQRMESFAKPLAAARNMQFDLQHDDAVLSQPLTMDKRKNFYLIFKEAVNNAIKYSGAKLISSNIVVHGNALQLKVTDDGVGFNSEEELNAGKSSLSGNGLHNMQKRAQEMKGTLSIQSGPDHGTVIELTFPLT
ncbi:MAG: tetratricopeptide repeat protein [Ferruginibacter sp.]